MVRDYQNECESIQEIEGILEDLKKRDISKKELKQHRNRLSAQLCRELAKMELNFLKMMCINQQRHIRKLDKYVSEGSCYKCQPGNMNTDKANNNEFKNPANAPERDSATDSAQSRDEAAPQSS